MIMMINMSIEVNIFLNFVFYFMFLVQGLTGYQPLLDLVGDKSGEGILGGGTDKEQGHQKE